MRQDQRMRILVVSDLHYRLRHFDWLVALVGDLADVVSPVPHEVQIVVLTNYLGLLAARTTVFAASGNHDLDGPGQHGEQVASWLPRTPGRYAAVLRRASYLPRPRPRGLDRGAPPRRRALRPHPPVPVGRGWFLARTS